MSRSVKKVPGFADRNPWYKNYANRRLRCAARNSLRPQYVQDTECVPHPWYSDPEASWWYWIEEPTFYDPNIELNYGSYRKYSCPWDICDWKWLLWSTQEVEKVLRDSWWIEYTKTIPAQYRAKLYSK